MKTKPFGRLLITDGLMQSSEDDEYVYHQSLVHPALTAHPNPKKVFIAGGGEVSDPRQSNQNHTKKAKRQVFFSFPFGFLVVVEDVLDDAARICMLCFLLLCSLVWGDEML